MILYKIAAINKEAFENMIKLASIGGSFLLLLNVSLAISSTQKRMLDETQWHYAIDPNGSTALVNNNLVNEGKFWVKFNRIPRVDKQRNS